MWRQSHIPRVTDVLMKVTIDGARNLINDRGAERRVLCREWLPAAMP